MKERLDSFYEYIREVLKEAGLGVRGYIKAQFILMIISFIGLSLGLSLISASRPILKAFLISIIDLVPVVGSGFIMIPWSVFSLIKGRKIFAARLIILYLGLLILRQLVEPKIIGDKIGLRPVYTFLASLLGSLILGPFGVVMGPIIAIILNALYLKRHLIRPYEEYKEEGHID